jgi:hypothetical protein
MSVLNHKQFSQATVEGRAKRRDFKHNVISSSCFLVAGMTLFWTLLFVGVAH